ncbi:MAG: HNH endonuclease [Pseudomonadota bacterium]
MSKRKNIPTKTRFAVLRRDGFRCSYCGHAPPDRLLEVDHVLPVAEGGTNDLFNLVTICHICNNGKGADLLSTAERFALVNRAAQNAIHNRPLIASDADEKRADDIVSILRQRHAETGRHRVRDGFVARHIVLLCVQNGSTWDEESKWARQCSSYSNWQDEQHEFLAQTTHRPERSNLEKMGIA